ncbi:hypothetical protein [Streptomyces sp. NPDC001404]|uniref:hypothetical protein n=1 Tax=Streptomyces sp. NPDC001404 TaxID=3364571 RepID=UPI0036C2AB18
MLLWDYVSEGWEEPLSALPIERRRAISLEAISVALDSFRPSFEALFSQETVSFVRQTMLRCRGLIKGEGGEGIGSEEFFDTLHSLPDRDSALGLTSLVMAISTYVDCLGGEMSAADTLEVMSASYEAVLNSERIPRVTPDTERQNDNCVRLIEIQRRLVVD